VNASGPEAELGDIHSGKNKIIDGLRIGTGAGTGSISSSAVLAPMP